MVVYNNSLIFPDRPEWDKNNTGCPVGNTSSKDCDGQASNTSVYQSVPAPEIIPAKQVLQ